MCAQLAYSLNGHHWQRSLRMPFISPDMLPDGPWKMAFPSTMIRLKDGSILIYVCTSRLEHGTEYAKMIGNAAVKILRLRKDGFIKLTAKGDEQGVVALRDTLWQGGPLSINLHARHATCAIYKYGTNGTESWFSHEDCVPFSGDDCQWMPQWRTGTLNSLTDQLVNIEVRLQDGSLYSIAYDGIPMMNQQAECYRKFGRLPNNCKGF